MVAKSLGPRWLAVEWLQCPGDPNKSRSEESKEYVRTMSVTQIGIVGMGAVTGYGWGLHTLWDGLISGKSAAQPIGSRISSVSPRWCPTAATRTTPSRSSGVRCTARAARRLRTPRPAGGPGPAVGLVLCTSLGEVQGWRDFYFEHQGRLRRRHYLQLLPSTAPSMFMAEHGFTGPSMNVGAACASGAVGVILARQWLASGFATDVIVSGTDLSVTPENAWNFKLARRARHGRPARAGLPAVPGRQPGLPRR